MKNDSEERLSRIFAAVRSAEPDTSNLEQYFETRVMARIREQQVKRKSWAVLAWRMVPVFATVVVVLLVFSIVLKPERSRDYFAAITVDHEEYQTLAQNF